MKPLVVLSVLVFVLFVLVFLVVPVIRPVGVLASSIPDPDWQEFDVDRVAARGKADLAKDVDRPVLARARSVHGVR